MKEYLFQVNNWWTTGNIPSEYQDMIPREKTREIERFIDGDRLKSFDLDFSIK